MFYLGHMTELEHAQSGTVPEWTIGDRMRKARESIGMGQAEFAREVSIGRTSIVRYETGQSRPSRVGLRAWALRTGVSFEWMCHGDTDPCEFNPKRAASPQPGPQSEKMHSHNTSSVA